MHRWARVVGALTVILTLASCIRVVDGRGEMAHPALGAPIRWQPCGKGAADARRKTAPECGELAVPIDYDKPENGVATIALIRYPATGDKIGSLLMNPGGPGGSGVDAATWMVRDLPTELRKRFDFVGFDPQVDYSPAGVARIEQDTKDYIQRCVDKTGKDFLAHVGTASAVKDMDAIRAALGDDKLTYIGFSYGTQLGSEYAEALPHRVRAMVLDGAVDPTVEPMTSTLQQADAFQKAFNDFAADCAKSPDCPLGTDAAKAVDVLHRLVDPLVEKPAHTHDPRGLSYPDALTGVTSALYSPGLWEQLTDGLTALRDGKPADDMLELADDYLGRDPDGHYDNSSDAFSAISCVDNPVPTDKPPWVAFDKERRQLSPWDSYGMFTGDAPRGACALWPVPPTSRPHSISTPGLPEVLVISTTHDPATPYADGVHLAEQLRATLLTVEGTQHTAAFYGDDCVDDIVTRYLVDLQLPPPDARC